MIEKTSITTLVENTVNIGGLRGEHGLSFLIRTPTAKILFDTGQSGLVLSNAERMGLDLKDLDAVVLSHGHYDHTGGLVEILNVAASARVFAHPAAVEPKFSQNADGSSRFIGMNQEAAAAIRSRERTAASGQPTVTWSKGPQEIAGGVWATGEVPRQTEYEDTGGRFFLDSACNHPDPLLDDQSLFFETAEGIVVVLGCCHAGLINTLKHVAQLCGGKPIRAVVGGMHLISAGPDRMHGTIEALRQYDGQRLYPAHCTGFSAVTQLATAFPDRCSPCPVGTRIDFQPAD
jgi:7,8-dihydropterin-6-yl-methyl-4-(beta-D-ribofuranosyl)aminobenzene 5'-phosphate synthase